MSEYDLLHTGDPGEKSIEDFSIAELVSELRKRDGVEEYHIPKGRTYQLLEKSSPKGHDGAMILRITD